MYLINAKAELERAGNAGGVAFEAFRSDDSAVGADGCGSGAVNGRIRDVGNGGMGTGTLRNIADGTFEPTLWIRAGALWKVGRGRTADVRNVIVLMVYERLQANKKPAADESNIIIVLTRT